MSDDPLEKGFPTTYHSLRSVSGPYKRFVPQLVMLHNIKRVRSRFTVNAQRGKKYECKFTTSEDSWQSCVASFWLERAIEEKLRRLNYAAIACRIALLKSLSLSFAILHTLLHPNV